MKHRLTVKIEKRFKRQLSKRFDPRYARNSAFGWQRDIISDCPLCDEFQTMDNGIPHCGKCPFNEFVGGCLGWLEKVAGLRFLQIISLTTNRIHWEKEDNKKSIKLLKKLREEAKKYIIWTENTKCVKTQRTQGNIIETVI